MSRIARAGTAALAVLLALSAGLVVGSASADPAPGGSRALWVWTQPAPEDVVAFAREHGVRELLVAVPVEVSGSSDEPWLRRLAQLSAAADLRLVALGGEPEWALNHAPALAWQRSALSTGLFAGVHLDVEPYQLPAWQLDRPKVVRSYLTLLERMQAADSSPLEAAVPFWYGNVPMGRATLADGVLTRVDAVTVLSYRDTAAGADGMLGVGADLLTRGVAAGKPVRLGAETNPVASDDSATFAEEGATVMAGVLAQVEQDASAYSSFAGVAVHDYDGWRALRS